MRYLNAKVFHLLSPEQKIIEAKAMLNVYVQFHWGLNLVFFHFIFGQSIYFVELLMKLHFQKIVWHTECRFDGILRTVLRIFIAQHEHEHAKRIITKISTRFFEYFLVEKCDFNRIKCYESAQNGSFEWKVGAKWPTFSIIVSNARDLLMILSKSFLFFLQ